jgi:hypothetical protein
VEGKMKKTAMQMGQLIKSDVRLIHPDGSNSQQTGELAG